MEPKDGETAAGASPDAVEQSEQVGFKTAVPYPIDPLYHRAQPLLDARREALERTSERTFWEQVLIETAETDIVECIREAIGLLGANLDDFGARVPSPDALATWLLDGGRRCLLSLMEANRLEGPPSSVALMVAVQTVLRQFAQECAHQRSFWPHNNRLVDLHNALWGADLVATGFLGGVFAGTNATVALSEGLRVSERYRSEHQKQRGSHTTAADAETRDAYRAYLNLHRAHFLDKKRSQGDLIRELFIAQEGGLRGMPRLNLPERTVVENGERKKTRGFGDGTLQKLFSEWEQENGIVRSPGARPKLRPEGP